MVAPPNTSVDASPGFWSNLGWFASLFGAGFGAVNSYFAVEAQKGQLAQQASSFDHAATMASINAGNDASASAATDRSTSA